jgi:hypothetical protein
MCSTCANINISILKARKLRLKEVIPDFDDFVLKHPPECGSDTASFPSKMMRERFVNTCTKQKTISSSGKIYTDCVSFPDTVTEIPERT